jgi:hypothetical protein
MRILLALLLISALLAPAAWAQVPRNVLAEDATATWCTYCPSAYSGLEVMKSRYDATEFTAIRYYATSGLLGTAETDARNAYYAVGGFPTVTFDGTTPVVGGDSPPSTQIASGASYDPIVLKGIGVPSPLKITINSVDLVQPDGSVDLDIEVMENIASITNTKVRMMVLENNLPNLDPSAPIPGENLLDVTRDVLPEVALSVSSVGQIQHVAQTFAIDPTWKTADLWFAVFVQDDSNKSILQVASTRALPAYSIRYWAKGDRAVVGPSTGTYNYGDFAVFNGGTTGDTFHVTLDRGNLPAAWGCVFTDGVLSIDSFFDVFLAPGESRIFHLAVTPSGYGYGSPKIVLTADGLPSTTREIAYSYITNNVQVLLVDDGGSSTYQGYLKTALTSYGASYGVWDTNFASVTGPILANFPVVVWSCALAYPTLTATDRTAITSYLGGGGKLFLSGQDIGWELCTSSSGNYALAWYNSNLHATYVVDDTNVNAVTGVTGDPISNGMSMALTAALNPYPDGIAARDAFASNIFTYNATYKAGIKVDTGTAKIVYLGFGFETITTQANRNLLMQRVLAWFGLVPAATDDLPIIARSATVSAYPNPAPGSANLRFELPAAGSVRLGIYALDGSLVRNLVDEVRPAGPQSVLWDGRNAAGNLAPSGVYFYRLRAGQDEPSGKLVLTR